MDAKEYVILTNSASKRALFPSHSLPSEKSDDEDSLGHMSPLKSSSPDRYSSPPQSPCWSIETPLKSSESRMFGNGKHKFLEIAQAHCNLQTTLNTVTPQKMFTDIIGDTPEKESRCDMLTPFKCLIQRQNIQETPDSTVSKSSEALRKLCWKKKEQSRNSPEKLEDSEKKNFDFNSSAVKLLRTSFYGRGPSKAKTSLFPETVKVRRPMVTVVSKTQPKRFLNTTHPRGHYKSTHHRPRIVPGEINAGVKHRVKRPKPKLKRALEVVKKSMEKPLVSPEDRLQKCLVEEEFLDAEGNTPVKRRRLHVSPLSNGENIEVNPHSSGAQSPNTAKRQEDKRKSPEVEVVPDPNRKFFKTNRTMAIDHKATVTVVNNVKIQVHNGKMALDSPSRKMKPVKKRPVVLENVFEEDLASAPDTSIVQERVQEVLQKLDNEIEMSSVADDYHNIQSITSSTSSLALHDEVKVCENVNDIENHNLVHSMPEMLEAHDTIVNNENQNSENIVPVVGTPEADQTLYPVFYKRKGLYDSTNIPVKRASPHIKKLRLIGEDQYQIDAGQSRFRAEHCKECGTLYHVGDPEDEIAHYHIHNNISTFRFGGWKNEHVVKMYSDKERVIVIYPDDPKVWVNKANAVLGVIDKEMGIVDSVSMQIGNNKVYLYVLKNQIIGALAAEPRSVAYRMINTGIAGPDCCTEETYPVHCGVSRIWTAPDHRRKGIATKLVDSLRVSFMFDHILDKKEIAFSVPTELGKAFAASYMNTPEFMVYYK